jgi:hypothetical protein
VRLAGGLAEALVRTVPFYPAAVTLHCAPVPPGRYLGATFATTYKPGGVCIYSRHSAAATALPKALETHQGHSFLATYAVAQANIRLTYIRPRLALKRDAL